MEQFDYHARDVAGTSLLARQLAEVLPGRATIGLIGTLGAGKTRFVQQVAAAVGIDPETVTSPTFVLCQQYLGRAAIYHMDAYRLTDVDDFLELGPDEYFDSDGWTFVEWSDRVRLCLPDDRLEITIEITGDNQRHFQLTAFGEACESALDQLAQRLPTR